MENKRCITCSMEYPDHKMSCKDPVKEYRLPTAEEWLLNHKEMSKYDVASYDESGYLGVDEEALYRIMIEFAKLHVIEELKKHIEHPSKPGYKRSDIIARIKELENIK